jgi:hypothetical protein
MIEPRVRGSHEALLELVKQFGRSDQYEAFLERAREFFPDIEG